MVGLYGSVDIVDNVAAISGFGAHVFDRMHRRIIVRTNSETRDFNTEHFRFLRSFRLLTLLEHKPTLKNDTIELHRSDLDVFDRLASCSGEKWKAALKAFAARGKNKAAQEAETDDQGHLGPWSTVLCIYVHYMRSPVCSLTS